MTIINKTPLLLSLIAMMFVVPQASFAQSANPGASLPAGVGEQPIVIRTNQPFANQIRSTLQPQQTQSTQQGQQGQTAVQQSVTTQQPNNQVQPRPQRRTLYGQPRRQSNQFGTKNYYRQYQPSSLPHFQYRQNQTQGQFRVRSPIYNSRNSNVLRVDKEGRSVDAVKQTSTGSAQPNTQTTADGKKVIVAPVDTNRYNKQRFRNIPKHLRNHPSWQGGHYLHFPDEPPPPKQ